MWWTLFLIVCFAESGMGMGGTHSQHVLDQCLESCGVLFDPMPEAEQHRSIGSTVAQEFSAPWSAMIEIKNRCPDGRLLIDRCSGSIAAKRLITTAGHCLYQNLTEFLERCGSTKEALQQYGGKTHWIPTVKDQLTVWVGLMQTGAQTPGAKGIAGATGIQSIILPHGFRTEDLDSKKALKNDFGILKLNAPLTFGYHVRPVCISRVAFTEHRRFPFGQMASWGCTKMPDHQNCLPADRLQMVSTPIQDADECSMRKAQKNIGFDPTYHLCAGARGIGGMQHRTLHTDKYSPMTVFGSYSTTKGDSGAALTITHNEKAYAIGLFSMTTTDTKHRNAQNDIYTRTSLMCDLLRANNDGAEVCVSNFMPFDLGCSLALRDARIKLANAACGFGDCSEGAPGVCHSLVDVSWESNQTDLLPQKSDVIGKHCNYETCPKGYICINHQCAERCYYGQKCSDGRICRGLGCVHQSCSRKDKNCCPQCERKCNSSDQCAEGWDCTFSSCKKTECTNHSDCPVNWQCQTAIGKCEAVTCRTNADCGSAQICFKAACMHKKDQEQF